MPAGGYPGPSAPVDDPARYAPGAPKAAYSPFVNVGPALPVAVRTQKPPISPKVWWIGGGSIAAILLLVIVTRACGGDVAGAGLSRDKLIERALAGLAAQDVDKLEALSLPSDLKVNDCKKQDAAEIRKRARSSHRESIQRLRRFMKRKDIDNAKIAMVDIEDDRDPSHYKKGSPAMGTRSEECEYTRDLTVHRLRVDVRMNGEIEDQMRIAAIEIDGRWYLADFLLGGAILSDHSSTDDDFDVDP